MCRLHSRARRFVSNGVPRGGQQCRGQRHHGQGSLSPCQPKELATSAIDQDGVSCPTATWCSLQHWEPDAVDLMPFYKDFDCHSLTHFAVSATMLLPQPVEFRPDGWTPNATHLHGVHAALWVACRADTNEGARRQETRHRHLSYASAGTLSCPCTSGSYGLQRDVYYRRHLFVNPIMLRSVPDGFFFFSCVLFCFWEDCWTHVFPVSLSRPSACRSWGP